MTSLRDRVHLIELPLGRNRTVNATLIEGDPLTLVDTGARTRESLEALEAAFARLGRRLEDLELVVVTHPHHDHFGAAAELRRRSGARVVGDGAAVTATYPESFRPNTNMRIALFDESGAPDEIAARWRERADHYLDDSEPVTLDQELGEGESIRMGGADFSVLSAPGHAATSIVLYQPEARLLIAGDILIGNAGASVTLHETSRPGRWFLDIVDSLAKLGELDVDLAYPGHGPLIEDGTATIRLRRSRALQRYAEVEGLVRSAPTHAWGLSTRIYPPGLGDSGLGLSQSLGYLEALQAEGRAISEKSGGVRTYAPR